MARRSTPDVWTAAERYMSHCYARGGSDSLRRSQRSIYRRLARFVGDRQVGSLTPDDFEDFFYGATGLVHGCAYSTLGRYRNDLKGFLSWCYRRRWCDDPEQLLGGLVHTSTRSKRERLRLSEDQMWSMVSVARDERDAAMLVFMMHTGCRISELLGLRVRDVRFETSEIRVRIYKTKEEDVLRMSPVLEKYLRAWLTVYTRRENPSPTGYLFPARRRSVFVGSVPVSSEDRGYCEDARITAPGRYIKMMAADAGVDLERGDAWHTIRRSVARIFFDKASHLGHDAALRMTSAFLHHKNTATTEIYLGLQLERAKRDEIMSAGFLTEPDAHNVTRLDDYREGSNG